MITKEYLQQELAKRIDGYKRGVETTTDDIIAEMKSILVLVDALPDYEKKYNEALNDMRAIYPNLKGDAKLAVEHAFPELYESEDERVIRTLYYLVRDHDWLNGATKGEALTWLEKQKESLHITETCKENDKSFADESEDERIRKWLVDYFGSIKGVVWIHRDITCEQILDWLEKQKEPENVSASTMAPSCWTKVPEQCLKCNEYEIGYKAGYTHGCTAGYNKAMKEVEETPKTTDSISPDCTPDAKCGDRWHKVGDSLPDNPREVLCKDEAGNYFIGRYYVGEGWDISNYDDEDKPHHLNPPVSKWIDFPSEKQKEQKPAKWSEEDDKIMQTMIKEGDLKPSEIAWLKSLRPSWKPSEEQMKALDVALGNFINKLNSL